MHIHFNKCSNWWLKCGLFVFLMIGVLTPVIGQTDSIPADSIMEAINEIPEELIEEEEESVGFYKAIKTKFIEGKAGFMSIVALALVLGLAFCIERIIYLCLAEIDTDSFMKDLDTLISKGDIEGAKSLCRNTRGPVASVCYQGLVRIHDTMSDIERSVSSYGSVQIRLFIAMAPSLGFLGTVIGMVIAFNDIQMAGDLNATVVAAGMKVALITTIFGIIVALILQLFYNYILSMIDRLTVEMEESAITLMDMIGKIKEASDEH